MPKYNPEKYKLMCENTTKIAKVEPSHTQKIIGIPKNLIGSYEGKNNNGNPYLFSLMDMFLFRETSFSILRIFQ